MVRLLHRTLFSTILCLSIVFANVHFAKANESIVHSIIDDSIPFPFHTSTLDGSKFVSKLYPNPASCYVIIDFEKNLPNNTHLLVYSFTGSKMADIIISNLRVELNLGNYYRGLYLYQLISSNGKILESGKFQVIK